LLVESVAPGVSPTVRQLAQQAVRQSFDEQPSQLQVASQLMREIDEYMQAERRLPIDEQNLSELWRYDAKTGQLSSLRVPAEAAAAIHAAWLARRLRAVAPDSATAEQWRLLTNLHAAKMLGGLGKPLKNGPGQAALARAVGRGPALIEPVLRQALAKNHVPAALAALEVLGETGDPSLLKPATSPAPHVLVKAANHPDRRIRLAAIETLVRLKPTHPLAGSSAVSQALLDFANFSGSRRAVVADPRSDRGHQLAALLDQCGFSTAVAHTGRQAFLDAASSTEVELVLITMTVEHPEADELLRQLRRDPRTARIPVGLIATPDHLYRAEGIALADPLTMAFVRPRDLPTMQERVAALEKRSGYNHVPHAERRQQAATALTLLAELADAGAPGIFSLQGMDAAAEAALYVPELAPAAIQVLARSRTSRSQKALVDLASAATQPLEVRQRAAAAFAQSVKRHRIQLTIADIKQQVRRYDESAGLDQPSQDVLWSLLETMQKTKSEVGGRKSDSKQPKLPQPL
jgi:CheY-like chemotaxis protein